MNPAKRLVTILLVSVFVAKTLIMWSLPHLPTKSFWSANLMDASLLATLCVPLFLAFVFRPVTYFFSALQHAKDQLRTTSAAFDSSDPVMVSAIIDMAKNFGFNVIAEGVETQEQLQFLNRNGGYSYQGYLLSKPVPIEEFEALL